MKRTALAALLAAPLLALAACSSTPSESDIVDDLTSDTSGWPQEAAECAAPKVLDQFTTVTDPKQRLELFAQLQKLVFEQVPFYKIGDFNALLGQSKKLSGVPETPWPFFWNAQLSA